MLHKSTVDPATLELLILRGRRLHQSLKLLYLKKQEEPIDKILSLINSYLVND